MPREAQDSATWQRERGILLVATLLCELRTQAQPGQGRVARPTRWGCPAVATPPATPSRGKVRKAPALRITVCMPASFSAMPSSSGRSTLMINRSWGLAYTKRGFFQRDHRSSFEHPQGWPLGRSRSRRGAPRLRAKQPAFLLRNFRRTSPTADRDGTQLCRGP